MVHNNGQMALEDTENTTDRKTMIGIYVSPIIRQQIELMAEAEDRSMSNVVERLLKTHPRIQPLLEAAVAEVAG